MFTQPRDPNNKHKPAYKKYCSYCHKTNHSISACFKKQRDDEDKRDLYARSKSSQKSFVQYFRSSSRENNFYRTYNKPTKPYDRYRRSTSRHSNTNRTNSSQNRYRSQSRDRYRYDRTVTAACPYPALRLDKLYAALIRCLVLWTVTKQFLVSCFKGLYLLTGGSDVTRGISCDSSLH